MIIKGVQPTTGALLCIQPITNFASLIRAGPRVESSLRSGNFPTLSALARQANNSSSSNHRGSSSNNDFATGYFEQHAVACVESPAKPANAASQPYSTPLDYTHSLAHTATVEPVHHVTPTRQRLQPRQRRPRRAECDYTPLAEPLSVIFPQVESLLRLPTVRLSPNPPPWWHNTNQFCSFH